MNDPLYAARSYACEKSRKARDAWLAFRASQGMPVNQLLDRFDAIPPAFQKQWAAARERQDYNCILGRYEPKASELNTSPLTNTEDNG